jgi:glyoxylase-like metal-dependent hydrolase (beta-lactamase superfamily II)
LVLPGETAAAAKGYRIFLAAKKIAFICGKSRLKAWSMNRRDFLVRSSLFTAAGLLGRSTLSAQTPKGGAPATGRLPAGPGAAAITEFRPLRREVGLFTGRGGTIGWLAGKDALVAVDTQFPDTASAFLAGMPGRAGRRLDAVINTHHHGDHTGGNAVFKPVTKTIVAHANVPKLQFAAAEKANTLDKQVYADTTFPEVWRREIGGEIVTAQYHGSAHTNGDVVVTFEKANVVHMGDLIFNRMYPVIDRPGGASIQHWIVVLEEVAKAYPADAIYVFGHGNSKFGVTGKPADLLVLRDYLSGLLDYVQKKITAGEPKERIVGLENLPGFTDFHTPLPNRLGSNLGVAFDELTAKKV